MVGLMGLLLVASCGLLPSATAQMFRDPAAGVKSTNHPLSTYADSTSTDNNDKIADTVVPQDDSRVGTKPDDAEMVPRELQTPCFRLNCRCLYPDEYVFYTKAHYGETILPSHDENCQNIRYLCPGEEANGPIWKCPYRKHINHGRRWRRRNRRSSSSTSTAYGWSQGRSRNERHLKMVNKKRSGKNHLPPRQDWTIREVVYLPSYHHLCFDKERVSSGIVHARAFDATVDSASPMHSASPTMSQSPTTMPSKALSHEPSLSTYPSTSASPSEDPTMSQFPSKRPSNRPSHEPSISSRPSTSASPSGNPTASQLPTVSPAPTSTPLEFETRLLVKLVGEPSEVTSQEIEVLEGAFINAYARVESCGERRIESVEISISTATDPVYNSDSPAMVHTVYTFDTVNVCSTCQDSSRLTRSSIVCPPPTEKEFDLSFSDAIDTLVADGALIHITSLVDISELEEIDCPSDIVEEFEAVYTLTFNGRDPPSDEEKRALEIACVDSYNEANALNSETCDPLFRVMTSAELVLDHADGAFSERGLQRRRKKKKKRYKHNLKVKGNCRGRKCGKNRRIFAGENSGRRSLISTDVIWGGGVPKWIHISRQLQTTSNDDKCYCNTDSAEQRLPTVEEFESVYNDFVQYLIEREIVTSVESVSNVEWQGTPFPPEPTQEPSLQPSAIDEGAYV